MLEQVLAEKKLVTPEKITEALADSFRLRPFFFKKKKPAKKALASAAFREGLGVPGRTGDPGRRWSSRGLFSAG